jgi:hypothetical protein
MPILEWLIMVSEFLAVIRVLSVIIFNDQTTYSLLVKTVSVYEHATFENVSYYILQIFVSFSKLSIS